MVAGLPKMRGVVFFLLSVSFLFTAFVTQAETASSEETLLARQSGLSWTITPLVGQQTPADFYAYRDFQSHNPLIQPDTSLVFFYRDSGDTQAEMLNLVIIHGSSSSYGAIESTASFSLWGVPPTAYTLIKDDPDDYYSLSPPAGNINWRWSARYTDGTVLGGLLGEFTLTIYPRFEPEIKHWRLATGAVDNPQYIELSPRDPLTLEMRLPDPVAHFRFQPEQPLAGEWVSFDASSSRSSAGSITQYRWDFDGDGIAELRSTTPLATHAFQAPGDQTVTLEIEDGMGRVARETRTIPVQNGAVRVTRVLKTPLPEFQILRGYSFDVELWVDSELTVNGLGIEEVPPVGWSVRPVDNDGAQFNAETLAWVFLETLYAGDRRRIQYRIEVPMREQPGVYRFTGRAISGFPQVITEVRGNSEMRVISALSIELAISRLNDQGEIDLTLSNLISFAQILQATALWQEQRPVPGTNGRRIDLSTMVRLVAYWLTDTPVNQRLP